LRILALLFVSVLVSGALPAQSVHPLTGRRIAPAMGPAGADWLNRSEREHEEAPEAALDAIGIEPGMVVADVGAGTGYITLRLARRVGPTGRVYAEDIQPEMLDHVREDSADAHLTNVETVLGSEADPHLPAGKLDVALLVDVYHEFSRPEKMLQGLRRSLKPEGRLVVVEYRKEDPSIPIKPDHKMSIADVKKEVEAEGFRLAKVIDTLPRQHIFVFRKALVQ
jgi:ubiquinone/menaquinone biosynthesis C-methylase UbiE